MGIKNIQTMETIYISSNDFGFVVQQDDRYADNLTPDEAMGVVYSLIIKADPNSIKRYNSWMQTREEHQKRKRRMQMIINKHKEDKICGR